LPSGPWRNQPDDAGEQAGAVVTAGASGHLPDHL